MSEPQRETRYPALADKAERLKGIHDRGPHETTVESCLVRLVSALEETAYQVAMQEFVGENFDNNEDLRNLYRLEKDLARVAEALEQALVTRNAFFRW